MEEDIKILEEYLKTLEKNGDIIKSDEIIKLIEYKEIKAISNVVRELETYKKIANYLAKEVLDFTGMVSEKNIELLIEGARKEVENVHEE